MGPPVAEARLRAPWRRHAVQAVVWGLYLALSAVVTSAWGPLVSGSWLILAVLTAGLWAGSEALRAQALRGRWLDQPPAALLLRGALAPLLVAVLIQVLIGLVLALALRAGWVVLPASLPAPSLSMRLGYVFNTAVMLWLWLGAWAGWQYLRRWRQGEIERWQTEAARRALELEVLRAQVNPHFLFNALNNLRALINEDPARARNMVTHLSNTLRHTLDHSAHEQVALAQELAVLRDYLALEQLHHEDRLHVQLAVEPGLDGARVPPMVLQLLVENAIKHGVARQPAGGEVTVAIGRQGERLRIAVGNPGRWAPAAGGLGLQHLRDRLARAGGPGARCDVSEAAGRVQVTLDLALQTPGPAA